MDLGLRGKKAIVTGGTRGIGWAIAGEFATEGCHVAICARDATAVRATIEALTQKGIQAFGNAGCKYDDAGKVPLNVAERYNVNAIKKAEVKKGC